MLISTVWVCLSVDRLLNRIRMKATVNFGRSKPPHRYYIYIVETRSSKAPYFQPSPKLRATLSLTNATCQPRHQISIKIRHIPKMSLKDPIRDQIEVLRPIPPLNMSPTREPRPFIPMLEPVPGRRKRRHEPQQHVDQVDPDGVLHAHDAVVTLGVFVDVHLRTHALADANLIALT